MKFGRYSVELEDPYPLVWLVADKNHPGYPDNSVTLLTEKIVDLCAFDAKEASNSDSNIKSYGNNRYLHSNLLQWLNSRAAKGQWYSAQHSADAAPTDANTNNYDTGYDDKAGFLNLFTDEEYGVILTTSVTTAKNTVTASGGSETVSSKLFLLSNTEVGLANENSIVEGSLLPLFSDDNSRICKLTDQCFKNTLSTSKPSTVDAAWYWWLRTPYASHSSYERYVRSSGALNYYYAFNGSYGVRPALNIMNKLLVSDSPDADGCYEIIYPESILLSDLPIGAKVKFGRYSVESEDPYPLIWLVADKNHAGYPDNSVTLLTEKIVDLRAFDAKEASNSDSNIKSYGNNRYLHSNLLQWLNSRAAKGQWYSAQHSADAAPTDANTNNYDTGYDDKAGFLNLFTDEEYGVILTTSVTTAKNTVTASGGSETVSSKLFLLSNTEVGLANENSIVEGSLLPLFSDDNSRICKLTDQCFKNTLSTNKPSTVDTAWYWWLRTPAASGSCAGRVVPSSGALSGSGAFYGNCGVRPALNVPDNIFVSGIAANNGSHEIISTYLPIISGENRYIGEKYSSFEYNYTITKPKYSYKSDKTIHIQEFLNNAIVNDFYSEYDVVNTFKTTKDLLSNLSDNEDCELKIVATNYFGSSVRLCSFTYFKENHIVPLTSGNLYLNNKLISSKPKGTAMAEHVLDGYSFSNDIGVNIVGKLKQGFNENLTPFDVYKITRPNDWMEMPPDGYLEEDELYFLLEIPDDDSIDVYVKASTDAVYNFGVSFGRYDGEKFVSIKDGEGEKYGFSSKLYAKDFPDNPVTSLGMRQVLGKVTTVGDTLGSVEFGLNQNIVEIKARGKHISQLYSLGDSSNPKNALTKLKYFSLIGQNSIKDASNMFANCSSLIAVLEFDTSNLVNTSSMFKNCKSLLSVPPFKFCKNVKDLSYMFMGCSALEYVSELSFSSGFSGSGFAQIFDSCTSLKKIGRLDLNSDKPSSVLGIFDYCYSLISIDQLYLNNIYENGSYVFELCTSLSSITFIDKKEEVMFPCFYLQNSKLTKKGLINIFNSLPTVKNRIKTRAPEPSVSHDPNTLIISSTPGYSELTAEDKAIATNKGWILL